MLTLVLKILAPGFVIAGMTHVVLGLGADVALGAHITPETLVDASLDSQNRFYGACFTLYGILLWVCADDPVRYRPVLRATIACFFFGGLVRLVSIALHGWPSSLVWGLALSELILPPVLWWLVIRDGRAR